MMDLTASEIRRLHRKIAQAERRLALVSLPGKVLPGSQDYEKRTLRLVLGQAADGSEILSPPVRWPQQGAGKLRIHTPPADNEQMRLQSPSGTVGTASIADWGTYDDDTQSPSQSGDEALHVFGGTTIRQTADGLELIVGGASITLSGADVSIVSETLTHNGVNISETHVHTKVVPGGGNSGPPPGGGE